MRPAAAIALAAIALGAAVPRHADAQGRRPAPRLETDAIVVRPQEAALHMGETVVISGVVDDIVVGEDGTIYLDFGGKAPAHRFSVVIYAHASHDVGPVRDLLGKPIRVSGKIDLIRGKPAIVVTRRTQIIR